MALTNNPFTPHQPIDPEYFAGRINEVRKSTAALNQTRNGRTQNVLLTGERGIGKTSLALYSRYVASQPNETLGTDFRFATAYYTVERNQSLADVCRGVTSKLLDSVDRGLARKCLEKLGKLGLHFSIYVPGIGELGVAPSPIGQQQQYLQADFVKAVEESWGELKETHNGILLIIDELHNLVNFAGVGSFFKVISEAWAADGYRQVMFLVVGLPQICQEISKDDPSAPRIFSYVELKRMTEGESLIILNRCLAGTGKRIEDQPAKIIARRSGGFPYFLHQLGYDAFEIDTDGIIGRQDVEQGLILSLIQFERMFFGRMYKSIEGKHKQKIVDELANKGNVPRSAVELESKLRIRNVHQYLRPLEQDGILEKLDGVYRLSTDLLAIYVRLFKTLPRRLKQKAQREARAIALSELSRPPKE
jgi:hypothetical protein